MFEGHTSQNNSNPSKFNNNAVNIPDKIDYLSLEDKEVSIKKKCSQDKLISKNCDNFGLLNDVKYIKQKIECTAQEDLNTKQKHSSSLQRQESGQIFQSLKDHLIMSPNNIIDPGLSRISKSDRLQNRETEFSFNKDFKRNTKERTKSIDLLCHNSRTNERDNRKIVDLEADIIHFGEEKIPETMSMIEKPIESFNDK